MSDSYQTQIIFLANPNIYFLIFKLITGGAIYIRLGFTALRDHKVYFSDQQTHTKKNCLTMRTC